MKKFLLALFAMIVPLQAAKATEVITLTPENLISLRSEVDEDTVSKLVQKISEYDGDTVYLYINSPGGSITAGNTLIHALESTHVKVVCIADFAASMAFSIFQSCSERLVLDTAVIMQHEASYGTQGSLSHQRTVFNMVRKMAEKLNEHDAKRLNMPVGKFQALIHNEWWMIGDEAVNNHAADRVVNVACSKELSKAREVSTFQSLFGSIELTWSACPLAVYPVKIGMKKSEGIDVRDFNEWVSGFTFDEAWKDRQEVK